MTKITGVEYHHITKDERFKIEAYREDNVGVREIARRLGRSPSSISDELKNKPKKKDVYNARVANRLSRLRICRANTREQKIKKDSELEKEIVFNLKRTWSPEQIAGRLRRQNKNKTVVSAQTVYNWIESERRDLRIHLRHKKNKYRRKSGTKQREKRREEAKKKRIDTRPKVVEKRSRLGDWEGDTIIGSEKTIHILTHAERKSRYLLADKVDGATAEKVRMTTVKRFQKLPQYKRQTITYDNGIQFSEHETVERDLDISVYFAYPYHSWERGTNENTNGLLREFFPKKSPFKNITKQKLDRAVKLINNRPRKCLSYQTPEEVFNKCSGWR